MVVRVLIVIVLVAVLGFFGTRGSEKVVAEVTERQEIVDELVKQQKARDERVASLEEQLARVRADREREMQQAARTVEDLQRRVIELERKEQARGEAEAQSAIEIEMRQGDRLRVDGMLRADGPRKGPEALHIPAGEHVLEVETTARTLRYRMVMAASKKPSKIVVVGNKVLGLGGVSLTPLQ